MAVTSSSFIYADEIVVGDMLAIGGAQHIVLANNKQGVNHRMLYLKYTDVIRKQSWNAELLVAGSIMFDVTRQKYKAVGEELS